MKRIIVLTISFVLGILFVSAKEKNMIKEMTGTPMGQASLMIVTDSSGDDDIAPLIKSKWNGAAPFNKQLPLNSVVGDIGVMLAQIMYYYKYPSESIMPVEAYNGYSELPSIAFQWEKMTDTYDANSSSEQIDAVAELMNYAARAAHTIFSEQSDASFFFSPKALCKYFGFDRNLTLLQRAYCGIDEWNDILYEELKAGRPVPYMVKGDNITATFIIDGYKSGGYFHINWGRNGEDDGYFKLSELKSGKYDSCQFSLCQQFALIGAQPVTEESSTGTYNGFLTGDISAYTKEYENNGAGWNGIHIEKKQYCAINDDANMEIGIGLYKDGTLVYVLDTDRYDDIQPGEFVTIKEYELYNTVEPGDYVVKTISRRIGDTGWLPDTYSDSRYACLSINGNKLSTGNGEYPAKHISQASPCHMSQSDNGFEYEVVLKNDGPDFAGGLNLYYKVRNEVYEGGNPSIPLYLEIKQGETATIHFLLPEEIDYCYAELPLEYAWNEEDYFLQVRHDSFFIDNIVSDVKEIIDLSDKDQQQIFSIEGILLPNVPQKGIYIRNGKKMVVR